MEELRTLVYQFFHHEIFLAFLFTSLFSSIILFRSFMIKRSEKDDVGREKKAISLFLAAGLPFMGWGFYSMSFNEFGFDMLNIVVGVTFSLFAAAGMVTAYDRWRSGQNTLDKYM